MCGGALVSLSGELTQPSNYRGVQPRQQHDVPGRELLRQEPLDRGRGRDLSVRDRTLSLGPLLPCDLNARLETDPARPVAEILSLWDTSFVIVMSRQNHRDPFTNKKQPRRTPIGHRSPTGFEAVLTTGPKPATEPRDRNHHQHTTTPFSDAHQVPRTPCTVGSRWRSGVRNDAAAVVYP